jgi:hypothetical protein
MVSVTPRPRFTPGERTPGTHCTGGWVDPRAGLDTEATVKILLPLPEIEPRSSGRPARSQTLYCSQPQLCAHVPHKRCMSHPTQSPFSRISSAQKKNAVMKTI